MERRGLGSAGEHQRERRRRGASRSSTPTGGTTAHLVYQAPITYDYWYLAFTGALERLPQQVGPRGTVYGPVPATIAARGADATVAFIDGEGSVNHAPRRATRGFGVWQARSDPGGLGNFNMSPVIVQLNAGPELMMAYVACGDVGCTTGAAQIMFMTRTGGVWTTPAAIANCLTNDRVALAPLPSGGAILAFRGTDTNLYWSVYSGGTWSTVAPFASPNVSLDMNTSPAVTHGVGGRHRRDRVRQRRRGVPRAASRGARGRRRCWSGGRA